MKNKAPDVTTKFKRYLMLEKSLAANTVEAYMSDLKKLTDFIKASGTDMLSVSYHDLQEFAATLNDVGIHPRSQMRIISGIRGFFRFLVLDGYLEKDPSELLSRLLSETVLVTVLLRYPAPAEIWAMVLPAAMTATAKVTISFFIVRLLCFFYHERCRKGGFVAAPGGNTASAGLFGVEFNDASDSSFADGAE